MAVSQVIPGKPLVLSEFLKTFFGLMPSPDSMQDHEGEWLYTLPRFHEDEGIYKILQEWKTRAIGDGEILVRDVLEIPRDMEIPKGLRMVITLEEMGIYRTHVQFNRGECFAASVTSTKDAHGLWYSAETGVNYRGEFRGLWPESGVIRDPRPWLERLVDTYFGQTGKPREG